VEHVSRSACFVHHEEHEGFDISASQCRGLRGEFRKGRHSGLPPKAVKREFFSSFGRFALKSSLLRALRITILINDFHPQSPNFAPFASLREILRVSVAALPHWVLRGENIFTANPEDPNILTVAADADLAADDVSDQSDDDDNERCQKGDHGAALELPAEGIIERQ
jgi:hypothetical protein